jgi:hypothetical protein
MQMHANFSSGVLHCYGKAVAAIPGARRESDATAANGPAAGGAGAAEEGGEGSAPAGGDDAGAAGGEAAPASE